MQTNNYKLHQNYIIACNDAKDDWFTMRKSRSDEYVNKQALERYLKSTKVFLGGTCNESAWRGKLIENIEIDYFNPVVDVWTPECQEEEIKQRKECDFVLYTITPKMTGVYSIAEVVDDSNKQAYKTILCILKEDNTEIEFSKGQWKSLQAVAKMVKENGGLVFEDLDDVTDFLNGKFE